MLVPSAVDIVVKDENVLFAWAIESASWEQDSSLVLLKMISENWVTMRGVFFARSIMELLSYEKTVIGIKEIR